ncbi:MAG: glycosyltransferase [bacterium]|nr:glycosyltransferase [bacterium]
MKKRLKVAHVSFKLTPGGAEKMAVDYCHFLNPEYFDSHLIITHKEGLLKNDVLNYNLNYHFIEDDFKLPSLIKLFHNFDIIHGHTVNENPLIYLAANMANTPIILETVHITYQGSNNYDMVTHSICVSQSVKDLQTIPNKCSVIYNGIDLQYFSSPHKNNDFSKIVLAEIRRADKVMDYKLDKILPQLLKKYNNIEAWIIGEDGPSTDKIKYLGYQDNIPRLLSQVDILVNLSSSEALSTVVIEAMAMGVVPIASNVGGMTEIIDHQKDGLIVDTKNYDLIIENINYLIGLFNNNSPLINKFREKALHKVKTRFDKNNNIKKLESLYSNLYHQPKRENRLKSILKEAKIEVIYGLELFCLQAYKESIKLLNESLLKYHEQNQQFLINHFLGKNFLMLQNYPKAIEYLTKADRIIPDNYKTKFLLGESYYKNQEYLQAIIKFEELINLKPENILAYLSLVNIYIEQKNYSAAQTCLRKLTLNHSQYQPGFKYLSYINSLIKTQV